ncbi:unnamed protein product [Candidula unifasciata]|uniref:EF-hand domain-containing protein n=1 Tax=Candidula unifasciata TaxID=100452 RepID=A0A8S3ZNW9_9EUPU|nr:unnamed protein product [Candidula unifasciata]
MKKKKSTKKKSSSKSEQSLKSVTEDKVDARSADPSTLISGVPSTSAGSGKKRQKKGQKLRSSRSVKALEKLEFQTEKLKLDDIYYDSLINHMHQWLQEKSMVAKEMFKCMDSQGEGVVSYDEFKAGMLHLDAPVNKVELHLLCKLLDRDSIGEINYTELQQGLEYLREAREVDRQRLRDGRLLLATERKFPSCPCCKMSIVEPWKETLPKYLLVELRSITFDKFRNYPGHLQLLVHSHLSVLGLIQLITAETEISSSKLAIFRDKSWGVESLLQPSLTLEECGFLGESRDSPEEVTLFYDYSVEFRDCPVLLCDHYFGQKNNN